MKVLVTGATGFIGGRIAEDLLSRGGFEVSTVGRSRGKGKGLIAKGLTFHAGDIGDAGCAAEVARGMDAIVHCAGLAGTWGTYDEYYRANVLATENLLSAAKVSGVRRFVNISSPSIYFDFKDQLALKEGDLPRRFSNHYARTKYEAEQRVKAFHSSGLETVSLRPRSVIGAGDTNVLPRLIRLQESGNLVQIGAGENVVDITSVGNVLDAVRLSLTGPSSAMGETYNISNGKPVRFWDFVDLVLRSAGMKAKRRKLPYWLVMSAAQLNEWRCRLLQVREEPTLLPISVGILSQSMTMDISKARARLGYEPRYTTEDGVAEFMGWWQAR